MAFPDFISKPVFHVIYNIMRKQEGATIPPIRRVIQPLMEEKRLAFDVLLDSALQSGLDTPITYNLPYPKADFLNYACDWRGFVAHGSILKDLQMLEPIRLTKDSGEFGNRQQIFCSPDAMWAMWFAILDKSKIDLTRNGSVRVGVGNRRVKYYHFELPKVNSESKPFADGMIYICRADDFPDKRPYPILDWFSGEIEEWGSTKPVKPLAKIPVSPTDFPYLDKVQFSL